MDRGRGRGWEISGSEYEWGEDHLSLYLVLSMFGVYWYDLSDGLSEIAKETGASSTSTNYNNKPHSKSPSPSLPPSPFVAPWFLLRTPSKQHLLHPPRPYNPSV